MSNIQFFDNKILFVDNKIAFGSDCCCFVEGDPCSNCTGGTTPATITLVTSGITICGCISGTTPTNHSAQWTSGPSASPNGTFVLQQNLSISPCVWEGSVASTGTWTTYNQTGCAGTPSPGDIDALFWRVFKDSSTKWVITGTYLMLPAANQSGAFGSQIDVAPGDCGPVSGLANIVPCSSRGILHSGGTASWS